MVIGVDVVHPMSGNPEVPSTGAMVASKDMYCMKYLSTVIKLKHREQVSQEGRFAAAFDKLVSNFIKLTGNRAYPYNIVIFRDGVSSGEF